MRYHHLYADDAGESHWRDVAIELTERSFAPPAERIHVSEPEAASAVMFLKLQPGWNEPIHSTPRAQMLICLAGAAQVTASDGETRLIEKGDAWRMEDVGGKGHRTEVVSEVDFEALIVQYT